MARAWTREPAEGGQEAEHQHHRASAQRLQEDAAEVQRGHDVGHAFMVERLFDVRKITFE
ncbi:hypothetical protein [Saccharothrix hoggarensis]|uniref:Uncharacterized protein n=1 Tax=Saccharothrix hoggarensis TaxID=913853 RepID=A0ABW3QV24_9PSEU